MLKRVGFSQVDSVDEVAREFNKLIDNFNQMETKVCQLSGEVEALKTKKKVKKRKGSVLMKTLVSLVVLATLLFGSICLAQEQWPITYTTCSTPDQLVLLLTNRFSNQSGNYFTFGPTTTAPAHSEGRVYYNNTSNVLQLSTGSAWLNIDTAGGVTLDSAYDYGTAGAGRTINVLDGAVLLTSNEADTNAVLSIAHSAAMATDQVVLITKSGAGDMPCLEFENTGGGDDIEGTGDLWSVSKTGLAVVAGITVGGNDITLTNSETIDNDDNGEITFSDGSDDTAISWSGTTLQWTTDTSVDTVSWGDLDAHTGLSSLTFDAGSTGLITLVSNSAADDLTISQTGSADGSVVISSAGTAANAIDINATAGGIDIDISGAAAGEDFAVNADSSIQLVSSEAAVDAIKLNASAGGFDIDSTALASTITQTSTGTDDNLTISVAGATASSLIMSSTGTGTDAIDIDTTAGGIDIDLTGGAAGEDFSVVNAATSIELSAAEDATDAINIDATAGGIDIDAAGEAGQDIVITNTGGSVLIQSTESAVDSIRLQSTLGGIDIQCDAATSEDIDISNTGGSVHIVSTEAVDDGFNLDTTGGVDVDSTLAIVLTSTENTADSIVLQSTVGGIDIQCDGATSEDIDISNTGGSVHIVATEAVSDSINIDATGGIDIDSTLDVSIDVSTAGDDIRLDSALGSVYIEGKESAADAVQLTATGANGGIDIDALLGGIAVDVTGAADIRMDSSGGSIDLIGAKAAADAIVIDAETDAGGGIDVDFGTGNLIVTGNTAGADMTIDCDLFSIDGTGSANISITANATGEDLTISQLGSAQNASVHVTSTGTGVDAISLKSSTGGIDIDAKDDLIIQLTTTAADDDINISTTGSDDTHIKITADGTSADALSLLTSGTGGGVSMDTADGAIVISADGAANGDVTVDAQDKLIIVSADGDATDSVYIEASTGTGSGVRIHADEGTGVTDGSASVQLLSDVGGIGIKATASTSADAIIMYAPAGGINIDAGEDIDIQVNSGATGEDLNLIQTGAQDAHILMSATGTSIDAIKIYSNGGTGAGIYLHNDAGTAVTDGAASIQLLSDDGGIDLTATGATDTGSINLNAAAGGITAACVKDFLLTVTSAATDDDMTFTQAGTTPDAHIIFNLNGTSADAFQVQATAGGIDIDAATDTIHIQNAADGDGDDITLAMTGSHDSSIILDNTQGTGTDAISLQATAGSVDIDAVASGDITLNGGQILVASEHDTASAISLVANTGSTETIVVTNTQGSADAAIDIDASAGGIDVDAVKSINLASSEATVDAIRLNASAGGFDIDSTAYASTITQTATSNDDDLTISVAGTYDASLLMTSAGTGSDAIKLQASNAAGDIDIDAGDNITVDSKNITVVTTDTALGVRIDSQGAVSGNALEIETTDGAIQILADGSTYGDIIMDTEDDIQMTVGGHVRIVDDDLMAFGTDDNVTANYDEDGLDDLQIKGAVNFETTYCEFRSNPVGSKITGNAGGAIGAATGDENAMICDGVNFEFHILGTGQTLPMPFITTDGLNIRLDEADNEGMEMGEGITARSNSAFTIGTDAFYLKVQFKLETVANLDIMAIGFRNIEAYNADLYAYDTYAGLNVNNGTINCIEELDGANAAETDSGEAWADGEIYTLEIKVSAARAVTQYISAEGAGNRGTSAVTTPNAFTWTAADVVVPFIHVLGDAAAGCEVELLSYECGLQ